MSYKLSYLLKTFSLDNMVYDTNDVIFHLLDKYDNDNTIKSYILTIISYIKSKSDEYDREDVNSAYKDYFGVINPKKESSKNNICLIVDE
jgi:hypothetical protein